MNACEKYVHSRLSPATLGNRQHPLFMRSKHGILKHADIFTIQTSPLSCCLVFLYLFVIRLFCYSVSAYEVI